MNGDRRSGKIVAVINCILNHNARALGAAQYRGINYEVVDVLKKYGVGMIQMPCPEMICLGLPRAREDGISIRDVLDTPQGRSCCEKLSLAVVEEIKEYRRHGYDVIAVLGGDVKSPGCAVPAPSAEAAGKVSGSEFGVFMKALHDELHRQNIQIPIRGIRDSAWKTLHEDIEWLENILTNAKPLKIVSRRRWFFKFGR